MESVSVDKKNWNLVEEAKACLTQQKWERAITLFRESRAICVTQNWMDGVRFADEMIEKATQEYLKIPRQDTGIEQLPGKRIRVSCPKCHKTGIVQVDTHILDEAMEVQRDRLLRVRVFEGEICEHEFIALIDPNYKVR